MIEPIICITGIVVSVIGSVHCCLVYRAEARKAQVDPERVRRFVESAPLHLLEELKARSPVCRCCGGELFRQDG